MVTSLPLPLLLLTFASYAAAAASLTPPPVSAPGDTSSSPSLSATPTSSVSASTTASANSNRSGNMSSTATSSAQFPSLSGLSNCAYECLGLAIAQDNCTSYVDVNCYCANATLFTSGLVACISTSCPGDLAAAESVAEHTSLSFPTPPPSTSFSNPFTSGASASGSATSPSSSATSTGSAGNGAGSLRFYSREAVVAGAVGLAGALLGVLFA
ncbi:hypothetical protein LXA43DRAFT_976718 [Ganoderma leucocontextum]|nr:hypothetical protein LXA43DRAFT_976718 [Ganoderma leucocontextum]